MRIRIIIVSYNSGDHIKRAFAALVRQTIGWAHPPFEVPAAIYAGWDARERGAAVIWLTQKDLIWNDQTLPVTQRLRLVAGKLMEMTT